MADQEASGRQASELKNGDGANFKTMTLLDGIAFKEQRGYDKMLLDMKEQ